MKTLKSSLGLAIIMSILTISGCKKPEKGETGPAGKDGNANIKSQVFTVTSWNYTAPSYYTDIAYSAITQDIIDNGAVLVYLKGTNSYVQLPITYYQSSTYSSSLKVITTLGYVQIVATDSDLSQPANPGASTFKIVVVAASGKKQLTVSGVDLNNYEDVNRVLNN